VANTVFTIGNVSSTISAPSNAIASAWVAGYILAFAQTPNPVDVPENATATQTLHAAHLHLMRYFRRTAIQAIARAEGRAVEEAKMAEGEGSDWG